MMARARRIPGGHLLFPPSLPRKAVTQKPDISARAFYSSREDCGFPVREMLPERTSIKLTELFSSRGFHRLAGELFTLRWFSRATTESSFPSRSLESQARPALWQFPGKGRITACLQRRNSDERASENVGTFMAINCDESCPRPPTQRVVTRNFGYTSILSTHELDEDFEVEPCKPVSRHVDVVAKSDCHRVSVRIEPPRAGVLDKELLRKRRTRPFSDQCWMQNLGVGLYRDKLRNRRRFSTVASQTLTEQKYSEEDLGTCNVDTGVDKPILERDRSHGIGSLVHGMNELTGDGTQCHDTEESQVVHQDGPTLEAAEEETGEENITDTDDEGDETYEWDTGMRGMQQAMFMEEGVEELEASLKKLESVAPPGDVRIGVMCLRLAQVCDSADEDPEKILRYGERALQILGSVEVSVDTAMCIQVIGSAYIKMDELEKAVAQLERSARILEKVEATVGEGEIRALKHAVQSLLGHSKMALGRHDEALVNYHESLAINERLLEPGNPDLGMSYQQVAEACMEAEDPEEAKPLCLKALSIYQNYYGPNALQVAVIRRLLSLIYNHLEDYEKVLSEHVIIRPILEARGKSKEVVSLDLASGEALISLERYKEAITTLKNVVKQTKENSRFHGHALMLLGKAYASLKEGKDAAKYCKKALSTLKDKKNSLEAGSSLVELASVYQQLNEQEQSLSALKNALEIFEQYPDQEEAIADVEGQIGMLFLFIGKVDDGLPYLEKSAAKIKEIYGPESEELLAVYNHIAIANLELGKLHDAVEMFEEARMIAVECSGPDDSDTLAIYHNLVNTYSALGRHDKAIEYQKHIVDSVKNKGGEAVNSLEEAEKKLEELLQEAKAPDSSYKVPTQGKSSASKH